MNRQALVILDSSLPVDPIAGQPSLYRLQRSCRLSAKRLLPARGAQDHACGRMVATSSSPK